MSILIERNVPCEMRDGCVLRANIYRDPDAGAQPALVFRTPYDKTAGAITYMALDPMRAVEAGYVVVQQDTRGRFTSEGVHSPWVDEYADGYDTIEWAARQPWSNGRVGAYGISYHGLTSWASAVGAPPSLQAIAPSQAPCDHYDVFFRQGAFQLGMHAHWAMRLMGPPELLRARREDPAAERMADFYLLIDQLDDYEALTRHLPIRTAPAARVEAPFFPYISDIYDHPTPDEYHAARSVTGRHADVRAPALITAGWHDVLLESDLQHYAAIQAYAPKAVAENTRLVIGPWVHGPGMHLTAGGEVDYGYRASGLSMDLKEDLTAYHLRWFDRWLKDAQTGSEAPVRIFVMGENRWRDEAEWPLARARDQAWHLHADGGLSPAPPAVGAQPRAYEHDPYDPTPTLGGGTLMPTIYPKGSVAQNPLHLRKDVLLFTSEILGQPIEVTGLVRMKLWASTSAGDADWVVKLCDVHPDGRAFNVCDGVVRASRRDRDREGPRPLEPDQIVEYDISLLATSMVFLHGHRLQLLVTSSDFPRYDRNPGTGELGFDARALIPARHRIYCDAEHPSHVSLPIVPRA